MTIHPAAMMICARILFLGIASAWCLYLAYRAFINP